MNKLTKNYLVIKNVNQDKNLKQYLEQICQDENISILHEEFNQFDMWNQKKSVYSEFNASPSSDILLWSYDENKLEYINYLYKDFEARYRNAGQVVSRIIKSVDNGDNLGESEKLDIAIRDDLSSGWSISWNLKDCLQHDLSDESKDSLRKNLGVALHDFESQGWVRLESNKKQITFKQKVSNFYNKHSERITYFCSGITLSNLFILVVLTIKNIMVK